MSQLSGSEQKELVSLLVGHLTDPGQLDRALLHADLGNLSRYTARATLDEMTSDVVRKLSAQYRITELVEAVLSGDFLRGHCPPIELWLTTKRDELERRKRYPSLPKAFQSMAGQSTTWWLVAAVMLLGLIISYQSIFRALYSKSQDSRANTSNTSDETIPLSKASRPLNEEQTERLSQQLGLDAEQLSSRARFWTNGSTINIAFLDGSKDDKAFVKSVSKEWTDRAHLVFKFDDDITSSEVRISFKDHSAYSYLGTDCLGIEKSAATMQLGIIHDLSDEKERRHAVLHEFGHMLGFVNEFQTPNASIEWNLDQIRKVVGGAFVKNQLIRIAPDQLPAIYRDKPFDPASALMYYPIPVDWLSKPLDFYPSGHLSSGDVEFVGKVYPTSKH